MHTCASRSQVLTRAVNFSLMKNVLLSPNLNSMCSKCFCKVLTHVASSHHLFWSGKCILLVHFALSLLVKLNNRLWGRWIWSKAFTCMFTCGSGSLFHLLNVMWPQPHHVTALKICALCYLGAVVSFFFFPMWMSTLCCFPRHQSVHTWMVSSKLPELWVKASDLCIGPGFMYQSCAGALSVDLTSCNPVAKASYLFYFYVSFLS